MALDCWLGGGLVSLTWGTASPAIGVSGIPELRGGGGTGSRDRGWYAVAVWSSRLENRRIFIDDVSWWRAFGHIWERLRGGKANLQRVLVADDMAMGLRKEDMIKDGVYTMSLRCML